MQAYEDFNGFNCFVIPRLENGTVLWEETAPVATVFDELPRAGVKIWTHIDRVISSGNKTIIIWKDGTKTIVSCIEGDKYDVYAGFCAALTKKIFGSTPRAKKFLNNKLVVDKKSKNRVDDSKSIGDVLFGEQ